MLLALGIAVPVALGALAAFAIGASLGRQLASGTCLPSDFPRYRSTTTTGLHVFQGTGGTSCDMTFQTADSAAEVTEFYQARLDREDWRVLTANPTDGTMTFERRSNPKVLGRIQIYGRGSQSQFEIQVTS